MLEPETLFLFIWHFVSIPLYLLNIGKGLMANSGQILNPKKKKEKEKMVTVEKKKIA